MSNSQPAVVALVVEDEWLILDLLKEELERAGWSVLATTRGERAVELLGNGRVDLVITDNGETILFIPGLLRASGTIPRQVAPMGTPGFIATAGRSPPLPWRGTDPRP